MQKNFQFWFKLPMTTQLTYKNCFMRVANLDSACFSHTVFYKERIKPRKRFLGTKDFCVVLTVKPRYLKYIKI